LFLLRSSKLFFDIEKDISSELVTDVITYAHTIDVGLSDTQKNMSLCESFGSEDSVVASIFDNEISEWCFVL
jgi:hypothetical protein